MNLTESKLRKIIKESVKKVLMESERGIGIQSFIEILPDEGVVLYNALATGKHDLERIKKMFPGYKNIKVDKPYWSTEHLRQSFYTND